jgi:predicted small metal-binding protein
MRVAATKVKKCYYASPGVYSELRTLTEEFSCADAGAPACPFTIRDENEDELISMVQQHGRNSHNEDLSREDVLKFVKKK